MRLILLMSFPAPQIGGKPRRRHEKLFENRKLKRRPDGYRSGGDAEKQKLVFVRNQLRTERAAAFRGCRRATDFS